jgi:hypothetical protein
VCIDLETKNKQILPIFERFCYFSSEEGETCGKNGTVFMQYFP